MLNLRRYFLSRFLETSGHVLCLRPAQASRERNKTTGRLRTLTATNSRQLHRHGRRTYVRRSAHGPECTWAHPLHPRSRRRGSKTNWRLWPDLARVAHYLTPQVERCSGTLNRPLARQDERLCANRQGTRNRNIENCLKLEMPRGGRSNRAGVSLAPGPTRRVSVPARLVGGFRYRLRVSGVSRVHGSSNTSGGSHLALN